MQTKEKPGIAAHELNTLHNESHPRPREDSLAVIAFTKRYADRSKPEGFQFEFFCDRSRTSWQEFLTSSNYPRQDVCTYSWVSPIQNNPANMTAKFVEDAKKFMESEAIGAAGKVLNQAVNEKAKEVALASIINSAKAHFRYCTECNRWVCKTGCWNNVTRLCKDCTPAATAPVALNCQFCGERSSGGRFCASCGKTLALTIFCGNCGSKIDGDKGFRYCPMCADSLNYIFGPG